MDLNGNKSSDFFEHAMVTACMSLILNLAALPNTIQYNLRKLENQLSDVDETWSVLLLGHY